MDNTNILLAANIQKFRKKSGLTQEELAEKLGVTFQAVSKWENAKSAPDILFLPVMADLFGCYIDELFSREIQTERHFDHCSAFPWPDDTIIRGIVCEGRKILRVCDGVTEKFTFEIIGEAKNVESECNITVKGNVTGSCRTGKAITVEGNVSGGCSAGGTVSVVKSVSGGCNAGNTVSVAGNLFGGCNAGVQVQCAGDITGDVSSKGLIKVAGNVKAGKIVGNVTCKSFECDKVKGKKNTAPESTECTDFTGKKAIADFFGQQIRKELGNTESAEKLIGIAMENLDGKFEMTDENIERLLDAYRDMYKDMKKKKE